MRQDRAVAAYNAIFGVGCLFGGLYSFNSSTDTFSFVFSIFIIALGLILLIGLFFTIMSPIILYFYEKHLLSTGECIDATITDVQQSSVIINKDILILLFANGPIETLETSVVQAPFSWTTRLKYSIITISILFLYTLKQRIQSVA